VHLLHRLYGVDAPVGQLFTAVDLHAQFLLPRPQLFRRLLGAACSMASIRIHAALMRVAPCNRTDWMR